MNNHKRRLIPDELIYMQDDILGHLMMSNPELSSDELWEYAAKIMYANLLADWIVFKDYYGIGKK